jgi:hypothetical protein
MPNPRYLPAPYIPQPNGRFRWHIPDVSRGNPEY